MTNTFKEQLRDYLTGKLQIEQWDNQPYFSDIIIYQNNLYTYILEHAKQPETGTYYIIKGKDGNGNDLDEQLLYGNDRDDNSSFIVILDKMYNPIQFIDSYTSGTKFGTFELLIIDDDGRFYGVENVNGTRRFIMLNNILVKAQNQSEYKVLLRQSYDLPENLQTGTMSQLIKKPLGNKYLFCVSASNDYLYYPLFVELTINVGAPNDWVEYKYDTTSNTLAGTWASWDNNDNLSLKSITIFDTIGNPNYLYVLKNVENNIVIDKQFSLPNPQASWKQAVILNENTMYYSFCDTDNGVYKQYIYKVANNLTKIFESPNTDVAMAGSLIKSQLYSDGLNAYISFNVPNANDTIDYYMGIIFNDVLYYENFGDLTYTTSSNLYATNTFHQFNLYSYYLQLGDKSYTALSIFNNNNYNGVEYPDLNGLVPNSAVLRNDVGVPLFARNLYNKVVNGNSTVSTVEIPSTVMNYDLGPSYEIEQECLYSQTNQELVHNVLSIDKNQYEAVDINFYNTLTMENRNDINNPIDNYNGAVRINKSVSNDIDYYDAQATKVKVNYNDGTNYIIAIDPTSEITVNNDIATYTFTIYAPLEKTITDLEIISYDEKVSYTTIKGNFTPGKYYEITQDVWVE